MRRKKRFAHASHGSTLEGLDLLVYILISVFYMELILRFNTSEKFVAIGLVYSLLFSLSLSAGVYLIATLFKDKARNFITSFALIALGLLFSSQLIYFKFFKTFYTVYSAGNGATVMEFMSDIISQVVKNIPWLIAIFIPAIAYIAIFRRKIISYRMTGIERAVIASLVIIPHILALGGIYVGDKEQNSAYDVYFKTNYPIASVDNLGLFTTMRLDLKRTIFGFDPDIDIPIVEVPAKENEPGTTDPTTQTPTEEPAKPVEYNVMNIDFDKLIAGAGTDTVKKMHQYFSTLEPTAKNDYTGMFKGYNLILITAEGFSKYAVDKDVTPTLYKMKTEGFNFTNFYNPIWGVSTSDGEYVATTSLIPKSGVWSYYKSGSIYMPFGMGNMMSQYDYTTRAYHNHTYTYYKRN
ncbi:MAG: LTA synthase family protein, partial [Bacillota bacterium]